MTADAAAATAVTDARRDGREESAEPQAKGGEPTASPKTGAAKAPRRTLRRRPRRKLRARKVERIVRRIDPWSLFKLTFLFSLCLWIVFMLAGIILWAGAVSTGVVDNVESFITELFALESFQFEGGQLFQGLAVGGFIMVLVSTGFSVLMAVLFNLISDLTGGIRMSVVELENLRRSDDDVV